MTKIQTLGPYALCLRGLLYGASDERDDMPKDGYTAYRSFLADESQFLDFIDAQKT